MENIACKITLYKICLSWDMFYFSCVKQQQKIIILFPRIFYFFCWPAWKRPLTVTAWSDLLLIHDFQPVTQVICFLKFTNLKGFKRPVGNPARLSTCVLWSKMDCFMAQKQGDGVIFPQLQRSKQIIPSVVEGIIWTAFLHLHNCWNSKMT